MTLLHTLLLVLQIYFFRLTSKIVFIELSKVTTTSIEELKEKCNLAATALKETTALYNQELKQSTKHQHQIDLLKQEYQAEQNKVNKLQSDIKNLQLSEKKKLIIEDALKEEKSKLLHVLQEKETELQSLRAKIVANGGTVQTMPSTLNISEVKSSSSSSNNSSSNNTRNNEGDDGSITKMNGTRHIQAQNKFLETRCLEAEKSRDTMSQKLIAMGSSLTKMQGITSSMETMKIKYNNLEKKQDVLLEILGEKTEEVDNLTTDISEMKRMYRIQTESLLEQLATSKK